VTLKPNAPRSASDEAASGARDVLEVMDELHDALYNGMPNRQIKNLRQVQPEIGQIIQITSPGHVLYERPPGSNDPKKVINPVIADEALLGKQHKVLDLCDGSIGKAHYYAAKIQIHHKEKPMDAYLIYRIRFFDYDKKDEKYWTSREDMHWWCKTVVNNEYFNVDEEQAGQQSREDNDPQYGRVVTDVSFRPLGHNPHASQARSKISRSAVYKLRHTDPTDFINGVAMNIGSFLNI
jgi:hypothetical protein